MHEQGPCDGERRHGDGMEKGADAVDVATAIVLWSTFEEDFEPCKIAVHHVSHAESVIRPVQIDAFKEIHNAKVKHVKDGNGCPSRLINLAIIICLCQDIGNDMGDLEIFKAFAGQGTAIILPGDLGLQP